MTTKSKYWDKVRFVDTNTLVDKVKFNSVEVWSGFNPDLYLEGTLNNQPFKQSFKTASDMKSFIANNKLYISGSLTAVKKVTSDVIDLSYFFQGLTNVTYINLDNFLITSFSSNVGKNWSYMFADCISLKEINASKLNNFYVTNMEGMFKNCSSLTKIDMSKMSLFSAQNVSYMFSGCSSIVNFDPINLSGSITNASYLFQNCSNLTTVTGSLYVKNTATVAGMFENASNLRLINIYNNPSQIAAGTFDSIPDFCVIEVKTDHLYAFLTDQNTKKYANHITQNGRQRQFYWNSTVSTTANLQNVAVGAYYISLYSLKTTSSLASNINGSATGVSVRYYQSPTAVTTLTIPIENNTSTGYAPMARCYVTSNYINIEYMQDRATSNATNITDKSIAYKSTKQLTIPADMILSLMPINGGY